MRKWFPFDISGFKKHIKELFSHSTTRILLVIPLFNASIMYVLFFLKKDTLPPEIPLFYSRPWGEEQLAPAYALLYLPSAVLLFYILSLILTKHNYHEYRVFAQLVLAAQSLCSLLALTITITVIRLIT